MIVHKILVKETILQNLGQEKRSDLNPVALSFTCVFFAHQGSTDRGMSCGNQASVTGHKSAEDSQSQKSGGGERREEEVLCCLPLCTVCRPSQACLSETHTKAALTRAETGSKGVADERRFNCKNYGGFYCAQRWKTPWNFKLITRHLIEKKNSVYEKALERFPVMESARTSSWSGARLRFQQHPPIKATQRYLIDQSKPGHEKRADSICAMSEAKRLLGNRWSWYHIPRVAICVKTHTIHTPLVVVCLQGHSFLRVLFLVHRLCLASVNLWQRAWIGTHVVSIHRRALITTQKKAIHILEVCKFHGKYVVIVAWWWKIKTETRNIWRNVKPDPLRTSIVD